MITGQVRRGRRPPGRSRTPRQPLLIRLSLITVAVGCLLVTTGGAGWAAPNTDPYEPPSVTVETPLTDDCAQRSQPPPPIDTSEDVPPGAPAPTPLPVPDHPVGGGQLGECGLIVPDGAPPLPSDITAGAWVIADLDTGEVLAAKDPHGRYRPASTLKLLTAQVLLTNLKNLDQVVDGTSTDSDQEGTRVGIEAGGKYTVRQLLTYLVINSGQDAANALARTNGGDDKTVAEMNASAAALGALDTRAATASGLDGPGQSTSAYDLALFARKDMATPLFPELISTQDARVPGANDAGYIVANDNQLLYQYPGALGGKTGFTDDAGNTYVGMAARDGRRLVVTMMHGTQQPRRQWMQAASLLDWGFALPAGSPPVGTLVGSLAEATAVPATPTPSTGVPVSEVASSTQPTGDPAGADGSAIATSSASNTSTTAGGTPTALILAGIGLLIVVLGVLLLLRRRHLNKRTAFAGDGKPAAEGGGITGSSLGGEPGTTGDATPAGASDTAAVAPPAGASDTAAGATPAGTSDTAAGVTPAGKPDTTGDATPAGEPDTTGDATPAGEPDTTAVAKPPGEADTVGDAKPAGQSDQRPGAHRAPDEPDAPEDLQR